MEFMVDRRMINQFLIKYLNPTSSTQVKLQMLDTMSKILGFTIEEKQLLGLIKAEGGASSQAPKGIKDSLISFFMNEDDE